ncbi:hypothetical protein ACPB67_02485 [Micromonospora taraxaci]|uniref:hypothetical protein n=1 Tax=Micromonospora taraxaci TaxID=1316803 RepID=UPI003C2CCE57
MTTNFPEARRWADEYAKATGGAKEYIAHQLASAAPDLLAKVDELTAELNNVAAAIAPTVTIKPTSDAARFLHNLYQDWVKTAHERLEQIDELTAELTKAREDRDTKADIAKTRADTITTLGEAVDKLTAENARLRQQPDDQAAPIEAVEWGETGFHNGPDTTGYVALPKVEATKPQWPDPNTARHHAPNGCDDCSVEPGDWHRYPECPGNLRAIERAKAEATR